MCGRYDFSINKIQITDETDEALIRAFRRPALSGHKTGEIFPTELVPVLIKRNEKIVPVLMNWGFPSWNQKGTIINAKKETAAAKRMFADPLLKRRCVIPTTGFYEWQKPVNSKEKRKYAFCIDEGAFLFLAGLYSFFPHEAGPRPGFVILTRQAGIGIADIHDRMPLLLRKEEVSGWLDDDRYQQILAAEDTLPLQSRFVHGDI